MEERNELLDSNEAAEAVADSQASENEAVAENLHDSIDGTVVPEAEDAPKPRAKKEKKRAVARKDMTMAQWTWHEMKRHKIAYLMILPFMLVFILFTVTCTQLYKL